ncbi:MAG: glycosyltransferase family 1 protein [Patescibacteria group bacterium]
MRILIDARLYGPRGAKGLGRYVQELVLGLQKIDQENQYIILLTKDNWDEFSASANFQKVLAPWRWYTLAEQIYLPSLIKKQQPDLVHFPHFNVPLFYHGRLIITIHDLLLRTYPSRRASTLGLYRYWLKNLAYRLVVWSAVRRAQKIIAVSEFTRSEIVKYYPWAASRTEMVYNGLTKLENLVDSSIDKSVLLRYNITKPFLLYVGNAYPHKNLENLVLAFKQISQEVDYQLVFAGQKDYFSQRLADFTQQQGLTDQQVLFLDYVADADLATLYQTAALYVFPSLYEGFGLPLLEAMSWGLPVVGSKVPCLEEIGGLAYEKFYPQSVNDIADKIVALLNNPTRQSELRELGLERIKKFDWPESISKHLAIYRHAAEKNKNK